MEMATAGMKAFGTGELDAQTIEASGKVTSAARADYDEQLKSLLGDDKFARFQDYEKTMGERLAVDQLQRQLAAGGTPLEGQQSQQLLGIMKEERLRSPASPFDAANKNSVEQLRALRSEEAVDGWIQSQQDFDRRVLDRARTVLSLDQVLALENAQKRQMEMKQMGVRMSREWMQGK